MFIAITMYVGYAINANNPMDVIQVNKIGTSEHGDYDLRVDQTNLDVAESGLKGVLKVFADSGYYVKNLTVSFQGEELQLGFEAGSEHGNFFREYDFTLGNSDYEFILPDDASEDDKVTVEIEYALKAPIHISYMLYEGDPEDDWEVEDPDYYGEENVFVTGYRDGDLVLPVPHFENHRPWKPIRRRPHSTPDPPGSPRSR